MMKRLFFLALPITAFVAPGVTGCSSSPAAKALIIADTNRNGTLDWTDATETDSKTKNEWNASHGAIFLAKDVPGHPHPLAGVMDIAVERNAFGRQLDSFETDLDVKAFRGEPYHAIFIRAPKISRLGNDVETLATLDDGTVVAAREGNLLATSFHPELTADDRFHRYFLSLGPK